MHNFHCRYIYDKQMTELAFLELIVSMFCWVTKLLSHFPEAHWQYQFSEVNLSF